MDLMQDISLLTGVDSIDESRQGEAYVSENKISVVAAPKMYLETYGCQMNFSDTEIVASIMTDAGYSPTKNAEDANVIFINTCSIRENAEERVRKRLREFHSLKKKNQDAVIGILGCMAERLKSKLLEQEKLVDVVVGPDAYRDLPRLISQAESGQKAVNVFLSLEETYADISPVRLNSNGVSVFVTIMRGCDNMCSFCVVPFTRGRERSRDPKSIVKECEDLFANGYREVTLLGQNVDSYFLKSESESESEGVNFAKLLEMVAKISPELRVRFSTSHPKDISNELLETIAKYDNICNFIHLPVQSGNNRILQLMNRGYTREWYNGRIETARKIIPNPGLSTDIITGFCSETEDEHHDTLSLMEEIEYDHAFMFKYSERPGTPAEKKLKDDVADKIKTERLNEIIALQNKISRKKNQEDIGKIFRVLIEGDSKRSNEHFCGRNDANKMVVFPKRDGLQKGNYANVKVTDATSATLLGEII